MSSTSDPVGERERLEAISAAIDGEALAPGDLTADEARFRDAAVGLRASLHDLDARLSPPDLTSAVLDQLDALPSGHRSPVAAAAVVFAIAGLLALVALWPGGPGAPAPAAADISERVVEGQRAITSLDARVRVVERGVHPDVPERHLEGSLRYRAPEQLSLQLRERAPAPGWPANDLDLVLDGGIAWRRGLAGCPVGAQPACLQIRSQAVTGLVPFAEPWLSPLDLVVPVHAFLPDLGAQVAEQDDRVIVDTTVARLDRLVAALTVAGGIREVHPTDRALLELDARSLALRTLTIQAGGSLARSTWAAGLGYRDDAGDPILELSLEPAELPPVGSMPSPPAGIPTLDAGFRPAASPVPFTPPDGFAVHRTGRLDAGGPVTSVVALSDGRAWIRIDHTDQWDGPDLFGGLGPLVRQIQVGSGVGYLDLDGSKLALHTPHGDLVVTGSVGSDLLVQVGASLTRGEPAPANWTDLGGATLPAGSLVPTTDHLVGRSGSTLVVGVPGPGLTGITIRQRPSNSLPLPSGSHVVETRVRGRTARYDPRAGSLTWVEGGWLVELRSAGLDLDALRAAAADLEVR
jgi:hypothetical protein